MLNSAPCPWTINSIIEHISNGPQTEVRGVRVPVRPFGYYGMRSRLHLAWLVFTGRADALVWPDQNPKAY